MPCLPEDVQSRLEYIFMAMLFFSTDRSSYGNTRIFAPFIDGLNKLQSEGIRVTHSKYKVIKLIPIVLLGDNLGLNGIMGFVECFVANHYCRICKAHRNEMATMHTANPDMKRTKINYPGTILGKMFFQFFQIFSNFSKFFPNFSQIFPKKFFQVFLIFPIFPKKFLIFPNFQKNIFGKIWENLEKLFPKIVPDLE